MTQLVSKAVGIDFGTTNSAVAVMNPTDRDTVIHQDPTTKSVTTPSCVWRSPDAPELIVGRHAFIHKGDRPEPISSIKRLMGTTATVDLGGEQLSPQQVSALILAEMKRQIETDVAAFDGPSRRWIVDRAVVTVPAYFDQPQIDATREADSSHSMDPNLVSADRYSKTLGTEGLTTPFRVCRSWRAEDSRMAPSLLDQRSFGSHRTASHSAETKLGRPNYSGDLAGPALPVAHPSHFRSRNIEELAKGTSASACESPPRYRSMSRNVHVQQAKRRRSSRNTSALSRTSGHQR